MASEADRSAAALHYLLRASHLSGADDVPALAREAGRWLGADQTVIHLVDYDQTRLIPFDFSGHPRSAGFAVDGTLPGRAFTRGQVQTSQAHDHVMLWAPLLGGTERLGVVQFRFPGNDLGDVLADCLDVANLLAELVMTRGAYGDLVEKTRRRERMTLPAEIQWRQLPPLTFQTPRIGISGVLMPTAEVAGDSFDYAVNGSVAHVAIIDAMGHGLEATLLATVAIGALRHARRLELTLLETVAAMDKVIAEQFGPDKFVTGLVGELALNTGTWSWIICGHPPALLVREGRVVKTLEAAISPPLGLHFDVPEPGTERLQAGDQLLLYSDGVIEGRAETGEFFGTERLVEFITKQAAAGRPANETLRRLNLAILDHQAGKLQDDVTTVLVEWLGNEPAGAGVDMGIPARR